MRSFHKIIVNTQCKDELAKLLKEHKAQYLARGEHVRGTCKPCKNNKTTIYLYKSKPRKKRVVTKPYKPYKPRTKPTVRKCVKKYTHTKKYRKKVPSELITDIINKIDVLIGVKADLVRNYNHGGDAKAQ